jgi:nucleotide-binding universal stress UspA family protein
MRVENILCPIDLSHDSGNALRYSAALARAYGATLVVFYCASDGKDGDQLGTIKDVELAVDRVLTRSGCAKGVELKTIVADGRDPAEAITRQAAALGVSLIVMCSRRRPLRAALLGSTAEKVYRTAPCPVLIMHPDEGDRVEPSGHVVLKRVLVAHDFSDYSELALKLGLSLVQEHEAELHLLHVLPPPLVGEPELAWSQSTVENSYHRAARALRNALPPETYVWCKIKTAVLWGKPYRDVLRYARENDIDLICMGAHGADFGMQALVGSNVDRVLRQSRCPVLIARHLRPLVISQVTGISAEPRERALA